MAGDWIKVEKATARKPEIFGIAAKLGISLDQAFGMCVRFWIWCDDQVTDGNAKNVTCLLLDDDFGVTGFSEALLSVGWLQVRSGSLVIPNFDRHLSESAKNRADTNRRVAKSRQKLKRECNKKTLQKPLPEKRREEKREEEPLPLSGNGNKTGDNLTFLTGFTPEFKRWWETLPPGMRSGQGSCQSIWPTAVVQVQTVHGIDESAAVDHLVHRTRMFATSPRGKNEKYRWSAETFLKAGHYDDDPAVWEITYDEKSTANTKPKIEPLPAKVRT